MKKTLLLVCALFLSGATISWGQRTVDERCSVGPDTKVEVSNIAGKVLLRAGSDDEVRVKGTLKGQVEDLDLECSGSHVEIDVDYPRNIHNDSSAAYLEIWVPASCRAEVETVSAPIVVEDLSGALDLQTVSGEITVSDTPSRLNAESVSGSIRVATAPLACHLETVSGTVEVETATDDIEAQSVSGNVVIRGGALSRGEFSTVSGTVRCEVELEGRGEVEFESVSGNVTLVVPRDVGGDFELSTFSGHIENELGPKAQRVDRYAPGMETRFSLGDGPRVVMESFSGKVQLLVK